MERRPRLRACVAVGLAAVCLGAGAQDFDGWFKVTRVADGVRRIEERAAVNLYLVEGRDRALLIDTGTGLTKLHEFVRTLTARPLTVVVTHAHPDHAGSYGQFAAVSAHAAEAEGIAFFSKPEPRDFLQYMVGAPVPPALAYKPSASPSTTLTRVDDGHVFDLGDRPIEVIASPGHTPGSISLLDRRGRLLMSGDTNNGLVWLHPPDALPLETYLRTLNTLKERAGEFDTILPGHGDAIDNSFLGDQIACVRSILDGSAARQPYKSPFGEALVAKWGRASVVFDAKKLWERKSPGP
jgi:glyoxylase-like metal-dependent hydrolase (beta-lactamase superfamily II)